MTINTTSRHCHAANPVEVKTCGVCGHDAQQPRMGCTCPKCRPKLLP